LAEVPSGEVPVAQPKESVGAPNEVPAVDPPALTQNEIPIFSKEEVVGSGAIDNAIEIKGGSPEGMTEMVIPEMGPAPLSATQDIDNNSGTFQEGIVLTPFQSAEKSDQNSLENIIAKLTGDEHLTFPGSPGALRVWIGAKDAVPDTPPSVVESISEIVGSGRTAIVRPFSTDFEFKPEVSECVKLEASGIEVPFKMYPNKAGTLRVGASVILYESDDCKGPTKPKSATDLEVQVEVVSWLEVAKRYFAQIWAATWKGILDFWGGLVASVLALVLIIFRKKIAKILGVNLD
jgi:hypothetical protein